MEEARNSRSEHDNYSFAPVSGEYNGVRTFAQEVKHVATANLVFYSAILGQAPPAGVTLAGATNGPDDVQTKEQIQWRSICG